MAHPVTVLPSQFARQAGKLGKLIDTFDWGATALGPVAGWAPVVRNTVELILHSPVPIVTLWGEEGVMIYNDAYAALAGARHPALLGTRVREGWVEVAGFNDNVMKVVLAGGTLSFHDQELTLNRSGQPEQVWVNLDYSPIVDPEGKVAGVFAIAVETTAKVRAERYLRGERERLHAMFAQAPGFMAMLSGPEHRYEMVNEAYLGLVERAEVLGRTVRDVLPEIASQGFLGLLDRVFGSGRPHTGDATEIWLNGAGGRQRRHYLDFVYQPVRALDGAVVGIFVQGNDITGRVLAERRMRESEARFRVFAQAMPNQVWAADATGALEWFNDAILAYSGYRSEELAGDGWGRMVHPGDLQAVRACWTEAVALGGVFETEVRLRRHDGSYRWHLNRAVPLRTEAGAVSGWVGTNTDIEQQKNTAQCYAALSEDLQGQVALRSAERERMWRVSKDILLVCGLDGRVASVNPAFGALLGWHDTDILGKNFLEFVHPEDRGATIAQMAALGRGAYVYKLENRYRRKDGSWCLLSWTAAPEERLVHAIGRDITGERAQHEASRGAELARQQSQTMETVARLSGDVAHDFNNLLQLISGNLQLLELAAQARDAQQDNTARWIANAREAVDKGARLAGQLLAFGRRQPLAPQVVQPGALLPTMQAALRGALGDGAELVLDVPVDTWNIAVDVAQFENALLRLADNARDAIDRGAGRMTISADNVVLDACWCRAHGDMIPGQYVVLAVADNGAGMAPEVQGRAFEPFFSTREAGKGTGLGLSMVYGFVKQSGGQVLLESTPGQGSTVRLYLPRSSAPVVCAAQAGIVAS